MSKYYYSLIAGKQERMHAAQTVNNEKQRAGGKEAAGMELFQMSAAAAVLILAVILVRAVLIHQLSKKTFLILWGIVLLRLFVPISIPSVFSIYSFAGSSNAVRMIMGTAAGADVYSGELSGERQKENTRVLQRQNLPDSSGADSRLQNAAAAQARQMPDDTQAQDLPRWLFDMQKTGRTFWFWAWVTGAAVCALFFLTAYIRARLEFRMSLPAADVPAVQQMAEIFAKLKRPVSIRQLDKMSAPLTYGIFHPVILLPKRMQPGDTEQLRYVLLHEYVHIRRLDAAVKLVLVCALCIHWFNPFVWAMYFLFNRDLELACDESVVRMIGPAYKAEYAGMLIRMEAAKSGLEPFGSCFSKNAAEERITAIMKIKKNSICRMSAAAVLVISVSAVFATSAAVSADADIYTGFVSDNGQTPVQSGKKISRSGEIYTGAELPFTKQEYEKLLALKFDGCKNMSISKFRRKVWDMTDTEEYMDLLNRFIQNETFRELADVNEAASFLYYIFVPLTTEEWKDGKYSFGGYAEKDAADAADRAMLEYTVTLSIKDPDSLTVGEYNKTRLKMLKGLGSVLEGRTSRELADESLILEAAEKKAHRLVKKWSTKKLKVSAECFYRPLSVTEKSQNDLTADDVEEETRQYPNATKEDYDSLLALMTPDYKNMTLEEFNRRLLDWGNEDYERHERITCDRVWDDYAVSLTAEEKDFVENTVVWSMMENKRFVESLKTGKPEQDPEEESDMERKEPGVHDGFAWCRLVYDWSYHISDKKEVTVGERDRCIGGFYDSIRRYFYESAIDSLVKMPEADMLKKVQQEKDRYTNSRITLTLTRKGMYQTLDSRDFIYHDN